MYGLLFNRLIVGAGLWFLFFKIEVGFVFKKHIRKLKIDRFPSVNQLNPVKPQKPINRIVPSTKSGTKIQSSNHRTINKPSLVAKRSNLNQSGNVRYSHAFHIRPPGPARIQKSRNSPFPLGLPLRCAPTDEIFI